MIGVFLASHDLPLRISLPSSISDLPTVVYSISAGVVPNSKERHRRDRLSKMAVHVDAIRELMWMKRYA